MKLSEIRGERVFEVIADLIGPVTVLAEDEKVKALFRGEKKKGESNKAYTMRSVRTNLPYLLKTHKGELMQIFAVLDGKPVEEYAGNVNLFTLTKGIMEMFNDEALLELFTSAASTGEPVPLTEESAKSDEQ